MFDEITTQRKNVQKRSIILLNEIARRPEITFTLLK